MHSVEQVINKVGTSIKAKNFDLAPIRSSSKAIGSMLELIKVRQSKNLDPISKFILSTPLGRLPGVKEGVYKLSEDNIYRKCDTLDAACDRFEQDLIALVEATKQEAQSILNTTQELPEHNRMVQNHIDSIQESLDTLIGSPIFQELSQKPEDQLSIEESGTLFNMEMEIEQKRGELESLKNCQHSIELFFYQYKNLAKLSQQVCRRIANARTIPYTMKVSMRALAGSKALSSALNQANVLDDLDVLAKQEATASISELNTSVQASGNSQTGRQQIDAMIREMEGLASTLKLLADQSYDLQETKSQFILPSMRDKS